PLCFRLQHNGPRPHRSGRYESFATWWAHLLQANFRPLAVPSETQMRSAVGRVRGPFPLDYVGQAIAFAMNFFKKLFGARPGSAAAKKQAQEHHAKGRAFCEAGEFDKAVACFDEALRLDSSLGKAYRDRGIAYLSLGEET